MTCAQCGGPATRAGTARRRVRTTLGDVVIVGQRWRCKACRSWWQEMPGLEGLRRAEQRLIDAAVAGYLSGQTLSEVGSRLGASTATVWRWVKAAGARRIPGSIRERRLAADARVNQALVLYGRGLTLVEIAGQVGVSSTTVWRWTQQAEGKRPPVVDRSVP